MNDRSSFVAFDDPQRTQASGIFVSSSTRTAPRSPRQPATKDCAPTILPRPKRARCRDATLRDRERTRVPWVRGGETRADFGALDWGTRGAGYRRQQQQQQQEQQLSELPFARTILTIIDGGRDGSRGRIGRRGPRAPLSPASTVRDTPKAVILESHWAQGQCRPANGPPLFRAYSRGVAGPTIEPSPRNRSRLRNTLFDAS